MQGAIRELDRRQNGLRTRISVRVLSGRVAAEPNCDDSVAASIKYIRIVIVLGSNLCVEGE